MTELEEMQYLIDNDPEFDKLHAEAMRNTNSIFDDEAEEMLSARDSTCLSCSIKKFFTAYKVSLGWCALMGKILNKIHGADYSDTAAMRPISGTDYGYIIYHDPKPWRVGVTWDRPTNKMKITVAVLVKTLQNKATRQVSGREKEYSAYMEFILDRIYVIADEIIHQSLAQSHMVVKLCDENTGDLIYDESLLVHDFTPTRLADILTSAFLNKN